MTKISDATTGSFLVGPAFTGVVRPAETSLKQCLNHGQPLYSLLLGAFGYRAKLPVLARLAAAFRPRRAADVGIDSGATHFMVREAAPDDELDARLTGWNIRSAAAEKPDWTDVGLQPFVSVILSKLEQIDAKLCRINAIVLQQHCGKSGHLTAAVCKRETIFGAA